MIALFPTHIFVQFKNITIWAHFPTGLKFDYEIPKTREYGEIGHFWQFGSYLWQKNWLDLHEKFIIDVSLDMKIIIEVWKSPRYVPLIWTGFDLTEVCTPLQLLFCFLFYFYFLFLLDWFHGLSDHLMIYSVHRLDLFAWCVRLSRLIVGFRTHFKSLHFHFISFISFFTNYCTRVTVKGRLPGFCMDHSLDFITNWTNVQYNGNWVILYSLLARPSNISCFIGPLVLSAANQNAWVMTQ